MLSRIHIKNFKGIVDTTIECEKDYNVFIGENNAGKTSIFEAIHLWKMCYDLNIKKDNKGFYSVAKNILFKNMELMRVAHTRDLFPYHKSSSSVCNITLTFTIGTDSYSLGFRIVRPTHIEDAYLQVQYVDVNEFHRFAIKITTELGGYNVSNAISINESRPVANIIAHEPKMSPGEIKEKISKGKGYEVLRNKMISNEEKVADHIHFITEQRPSFSSSDKGAYLEMKVDGKDILSCGSGFIQLIELFSSIEYTNALIKILLIDEPDAHIHVKVQRKLVERLQHLPDYQLFIISHNERFVNETRDSKLFHIKDLSSNANNIEHIDPKIRPLLIEGLNGIVNEIDQWKSAQKIVLVEGSTDESFLETLLEKYSSITGVGLINTKLYKLRGIDYLYSKLDVLTRSMDDVIPDKKWLLIRDTDCYPNSRIERLNTFFVNGLKRGLSLEIYCQNGYGIESTFMTDLEYLARLLHYKYQNVTTEDIKAIVGRINIDYANKIQNSSDRLYIELKKHFDRQIAVRRYYKGVMYADVLHDITSGKIQYMMTKQIVDWYLEDIHNEIKTIDTSITSEALTHESIFNLYLENLNSIDDIFPCHIEMIEKINTI